MTSGLQFYLRANSLCERAAPGHFSPLGLLCPIIPAPSHPHRHLPERRAATLPPRGPPNLGDTRGHPSPAAAEEPPASAKPTLGVPGPPRVPLSRRSSGTGSAATQPGPRKVSPWDCGSPRASTPRGSRGAGHRPCCPRASAGAAHRVPRDRQRLRGLGGQQGVTPRAHPRAPSRWHRVRPALLPAGIRLCPRDLGD